MDIVSKLSEINNAFENPEDAISYMKENGMEREITVYDISTKDALNKTKVIYDFIKEYNKGKPLNEQILPGNPLYDSTNRNKGYNKTIGGDPCNKGLTEQEKKERRRAIQKRWNENNRDKICLFTKYNDSVLDTSVEKANITPSLKAITSLCMMADMMYNNRKDD